MINRTPLVESLLNSNFEQANALIASGEHIPKDIRELDLNSIYSRVITGKAFHIIDQLIADGVMETDIYEYDSFDKSIFQYFVYSLSSDEESIAFLGHFIGQLDNINDEVRDQTILSFMLENKASVEIIKCLIDAGCSTGYLNKSDENLIFQVVNKNMVDPKLTAGYIDLLVNDGVDINKGNVVGETPLLAAVKRNKIEAAQVLLEQGADPNEQDKEGNTAFYWAAAQMYSEKLYDVLAAHATPDFDLVTRDGMHLLTEYLRKVKQDTDIPLLVKLIEQGANLKQTSLNYGQQKSGLDWLAEKSASMLEAVFNTGTIEVNEQDDLGNTLLHKVCAVNVNYDENAAKETYRKVKFLLEQGADPSIINNKDETALMLASDDNIKTKTVQLLLSKSIK